VAGAKCFFVLLLAEGVFGARDWGNCAKCAAHTHTHHITSRMSRAGAAAVQKV